MTDPTHSSFLGKRRVPPPSELAAMIQWPKLHARGPRIARAYDIEDLRAQARRAAPRAVFDFVDGGAGDESALRRNLYGFDSARLVPRVLRDVAAVDTSVRIFDRTLAAPIILGPVGMTRVAHAHGEIGTARAAMRAGVPYVVSTMTSTTPENITEHAPDADRWFQLYLWRDRDASCRLIDRVLAAGYSTLVMTVDVPVAGTRLRDERNGMTFPPRLTLRSTANIATRPGWWFDAITRDPVRLAVLQNESGGFVAGVNRIFDPSVTFDDLAWLRETWPGKLVVKGILSAADAMEAVSRGADGIVLSNHGGRQLEGAVSALEMLPDVRAALPETPLFIDGGVRTGAHIAIAMAAGADAVLIGRPYVYGLMAGGEHGADRAIEILRAGFERALALMGASSPVSLRPSDVRL